MQEAGSFVICIPLFLLQSLLTAQDQHLTNNCEGQVAIAGTSTNTQDIHTPRGCSRRRREGRGTIGLDHTELSTPPTLCFKNWKSEVKLEVLRTVRVQTFST